MERRRFLFTLNGKKMVLVEAYERDEAAEFLVKVKKYRYNQIALNAVYSIKQTYENNRLHGLPWWNVTVK